MEVTSQKVSDSVMPLSISEILKVKKQKKPVDSPSEPPVLSAQVLIPGQLIYRVCTDNLNRILQGSTSLSRF